MRKRTLAREIAMRLLYQYDIWERAAGADAEAPPEVDVEGLIAATTDDAEVREFIRTLYHGARDSIEVADRLISDVVDRWKLERIAAIDRAILRLAIFELGELSEVPPKVVINEAIELAKKYSTAQSGAFINGILDRLLFLRGDSGRPDEGNPNAAVRRDEEERRTRAQRRDAEERP